MKGYLHFHSNLSDGTDSPRKRRKAFTRRLPAGPQCQFLREAFAGGCRFTIGSDAHCLADIGRTSEAWALIDALGIPEERIGKPVLLKDKKLFS